MQEIDINDLINLGVILKEIIPNDIIIIGKIPKLYINHICDVLDLSKVECNEIIYYNQKGESIKNHILPNNLEELDCLRNKLTSLPNLPNSLIELYCNHNKLTSLPNLPNSLKELNCGFNQLISFSNNQLPNLLENLYSYNNCFASLPEINNISHELLLYFYQDIPMDYIPYNTKLKLNNLHKNKIIIKDYPHNPITNQEELDRYMDYIKNYEIKRIKSARK